MVSAIRILIRVEIIKFIARFRWIRRRRRQVRTISIFYITDVDHIGKRLRQDGRWLLWFLKGYYLLTHLSATESFLKALSPHATWQCLLSSKTHTGILRESHARDPNSLYSLYSLCSLCSLSHRRAPPASTLRRHVGHCDEVVRENAMRMHSSKRKNSRYVFAERCLSARSTQFACALFVSPRLLHANNLRR